MKNHYLQSALAIIFAGIGAYFHMLLGPLIVLLIVMLIDYATGMAQAWASATLSSRTGILGIIKKIGYLVAVAVAVVVDYIIQLAASGAGLQVPTIYAFGLLVTIWLILNELISILENLSEIGVPLPKFLMRIVEKLKKSTETQGDAQAEVSEPDTETLPQHPPDDDPKAGR